MSTDQMKDEYGRPRGPAHDDGTVGQDGREGHRRVSGRQHYTPKERVADADAYVRNRKEIADAKTTTTWEDEHLAYLTEHRFDSPDDPEFAKFNAKPGSFSADYIKAAPFDRESAGRPMQASAGVDDIPTGKPGQYVRITRTADNQGKRLWHLDSPDADPRFRHRTLAQLDAEFRGGPDYVCLDNEDVQAQPVPKGLRVPEGPGLAEEGEE